MSVELTFCHLWEDFNHRVQPYVYMLIVPPYLETVVQKAPTNEMINDQYLTYHIHKVHQLKEEKPPCILLVLVSFETFPESVIINKVVDILVI